MRFPSIVFSINHVPTLIDSLSHVVSFTSKHRWDDAIAELTEVDRMMLQINSQVISDEKFLDGFSIVGAESNNNRIFSQDMLGWVTLHTTTENNDFSYPVWKAHVDF